MGFNSGFKGLIHGYALRLSGTRGKSENLTLSIFCAYIWLLLLLLPLALQPAVGFGLSNNTSLFVPIYHQLSPSSHSQHLKISFHFFSPPFPGSSPSSRPFQFLSEDFFGASYPPPFSPGDPANLSYGPLSILLIYMTIQYLIQPIKLVTINTGWSTIAQPSTHNVGYVYSLYKLKLLQFNHLG